MPGDTFDWGSWDTQGHPFLRRCGRPLATLSILAFIIWIANLLGLENVFSLAGSLPFGKLPRNIVFQSASKFRISPHPVAVGEAMESFHFENHPMSSYRPQGQFSTPPRLGAALAPVIIVATIVRNPSRDLFGLTYQSLRDQSLQSFRWIIVDDHSDDHDSVTYLESLPRLDPRISVVRNSGLRGPTYARNLALDIIKESDALAGCFLAAYDLFELTVLEKAAWTLATLPEWDLVGAFGVVFGVKQDLLFEGLHSGAANYRRVNTTRCLHLALYPCA